MKQFLKFTLASIVGFFISLLFITLIFLLFISVIISSLDTTESVSVADNSILEIKLDYEIPERTSSEPEVGFAAIPSLSKTIGLNDIQKIIQNAKTDEKIKGIYLDLDNLYVGSISKINTIREYLIDFKESGKFLIAHGNRISEGAYYIGTSTDSLFITPTGELEFNGFGIEVAFFKDALDKLEIEPQIFQHGKYKSAVEPFKEKQLSEFNREQLNEYLYSVYNFFIENISIETGLEEDNLKNIASNLDVTSAESAFELGLVDGLKYEDQVDTLFQALIGSHNIVKKISFKKYLYGMNSDTNSSRNRIAIIYALGEITEGSGDEFTIGMNNIIKSIRTAVGNSRIKAIVMRVNSPGGSPLTSDMIWREIELASQEKPFIVSMGDIAASGGYYISCNSDYIVAEPSTLAGSIGVFGIIPNTQNFFNNKLGITFDRVQTGENSTLFSLTKPLNKRQREVIQITIDEIYDDFIKRVAEGRKMKPIDVENVAQGRIWSGIDAKNAGLVDTLGGLNLALEIAAKKADITDYKVIEYPVQKEPFEKIIELLSTEVKTLIIDEEFATQLNQINKLKNALKYTGIQVRLPFDYRIE